MTAPLYGLFGGTFDPVHNGHLDTVASVQSQCALAKIYFIPSALPPHRDIPGASPHQRREMVALAINDYPDFDLDGRELRRVAPSYTFDTITSLQADNPGRNYCFIIGVDALLGFEKWHRWRELLERVHFIVMERPGWSARWPLPEWWSDAAAGSVDELRELAGGRILPVKVAPRPVSATEIRYAIAHGHDVGVMLPKPVRDYIRRHHLYLKPRI